MPEVHFFKMQGAGNDFIVIDNFHYGLKLQQIIDAAPRLCNRRFGIGADGIMLLEKPQKPSVDFTMVYRNADGSDAGMCGNGSRCLAVFAARKGLGKKLRFNVHDATYEAEVDGDYAEISFPDVEAPIPVQSGDYQLLQVYTGTEHVVLLSEKQLLEDEEELHRRGIEIRTDSQFLPNGTNVNFLYRRHHDELKLQTFEKGVEGLTLACGTGAIASAVAAHHAYEKDRHQEYKIKVKGGNLRVSFNFDAKKNRYRKVVLKGPASIVFDGHVQI
jgi:diaminopimelate epimerase